MVYLWLLIFYSRLLQSCFDLILASSEAFGCTCSCWCWIWFIEYLLIIFLWSTPSFNFCFEYILRCFRWIFKVKQIQSIHIWQLNNVHTHSCFLGKINRRFVRYNNFCVINDRFYCITLSLILQKLFIIFVIQYQHFVL